MLSFPAAMAVSPVDLLPVQEKVNTIGQELQQKAVQYVQEGNFSASHLNQEMNETKNDLMQQASEQLNQNLPLNAQELQQRAKDELESRAAQTPGFELAFTIVGLLSAVILARRFS
jgi:PGF-CTERM protein